MKFENLFQDDYSRTFIVSLLPPIYAFAPTLNINCQGTKVYYVGTPVTSLAPTNTGGTARNCGQKTSTLTGNGSPGGRTAREMLPPSTGCCQP